MAPLKRNRLPSTRNILRLRKASRKARRDGVPRPTQASNRAYVNRYRGWVPPRGRSQRLAGSEGELSRKRFGDVTPSYFWSKYVSQRRPVLLTEALRNKAWRSQQGWTLDSLLEKVYRVEGAIFEVGKCEQGDTHIAVEERSDSMESFGRGRKVQMSFRAFVKRLKQGSQDLYLTTQEIVTGVGGEPELTAPPTSCLREDINIQPPLTGNLIPQQINLWIGSSSKGVSSGLHHDYHDNLYLLLRGSKRFTLWSPADAHRMHTYGQVQKVHPNGRIVYQGQGNVLADGSTEENLQLHLQASRVPDLCNGDTDAHAAGSDADLEEQLAHVLDSAVARETDGINSDAWDNLRDDYVDDESGSPQEEPEPDSGLGQQEYDPPSFSHIDLTADPTRLAADFPDFPGVSSALTCTLQAGDMLYLPAGWFHEVTSLNGDSRGNSEDPQFHMALNYWFHPPDNPDISTNGFARPYLNQYWAEMFKRQQQQAGTTSF